jgi:WD40 repeat protein
LRLFEAAWQNGQRPDIDDYLHNPEAERRALLIELVHEDLEFRLRAGEPARVETYWHRYPELCASPAVAVEFIVAEHDLRRLLGEAPALQEYLGRFPEHAEALRGKFGESAGGNDSPDEAPQAIPAPQSAQPGAADVSGDAGATIPPTAAPSTPESPHTPPAPEWTAAAGYEVLGVLGRGGMGIVYKAMQVGVRRIVALKTILQADYATAEERNRFQAEAEAIGRLTHPHIVTVYEVGEHNGLPYFSLEYCPGGSLEKQLDGTPWEAQRAAVLVRSLAEAVQAAHQAGIIHRDLKPGNVLLAADGTPKVTDFGLAKRVDVSGHTQSGAIVGTPSYMAPEQASGSKTLGPAADVYALGAVLYELLTGRPPFKAATPMDTVLQLLSEEPVPVRRLQPQVPRDLETICHKCLEKDSRKRYPSAAALAEDLRRFGDGEPVHARPVGPVGRLAKWARRRPAVGALLLLVAVVTAAGLGGILWALGEARREAKNAKDEANNTRKEKERADDKTIEAQRKEKEAREQEKEAQFQAYVAQISRADMQLQMKDPAGALLTLERVRPENRGWEYGYLWRSAEGTPLTLRGHRSGVVSVAYSPDGARIASTSVDNTMKVWDAESGTEIATLRVDTGPGTSLTSSLDGSRIASTSNDSLVKLWDAKSGNQIATFGGHRSNVSSMAFSLDGSRIASGSRDGTVKVWDARSGTEVATLRGHKLPVNSVAFSPDGSRIASNSMDQTVKVWEAKSGTEIATLRGTIGTPLAFSRDGSRIATQVLVNRGAVKLWDARSGVAIVTFLGHTAAFLSLSFSPDGSQIAGGSADSTVKVWDTQSGAEIVTFRGHTGMVTSVAYSPDGSRIVSGSADDTVKVWDMQGTAEVATFRRPTGQVYSVAYSPDRSHLATGSEDGAVKLWDMNCGVEIATLPGQARTFTYSLAYNSDGSQIAIGSRRPAGALHDDHTVKVRDTHTGAEVHTLRGHRDSVTCVAYSPDGSRIASSSVDQTVKVWDAKRGTAVATFRGHTGPVWSVAYSPDGSRIAAGEVNTVKVWDAHRGAEIAALRGHNGGVGCLAWSPDGSRIVSCGDNTVRVWDANSGATIFTLRGHTQAVTSLAYAPDRYRIFSCSADQTVKVWDSQRGTEIVTLRGHTGIVNSIASTRGAPCIATASVNGGFKVWDPRSITPIAILRGHTSRVSNVSYSPDGTRLASASWDGTVKVWDPQRGVEITTLRGLSGPSTFVGYTTDGSRIVAADITRRLLLWDVAGNLLPDEKPPQQLTSSNVSSDGKHIALIDDERIAIWRRRPEPGEDDPWAEDAERRRVQGPVWHAAEAEAAQRRADTFAASFHRRWLSQGDNLRLLAWARLAGGQKDASLQTLRQMQQDQQLLAASWQLSARLASGLALRPTPGAALVAEAIVPLARQEQRRRACVLVRAASLLPDSGIASANLVGLARSCVEDEPQSWQSRELLGAALLRGGKAADALRELDEAARLHGKDGSLWTKLFLALAHECLGHGQEAEEWQKKVGKAGPWEEQVMQIHLLGELHVMKRKAKP